MTSATLVLLLKAPVAGTVKTRLAADIGAEPALRVYRQLVERQLQALPGGHRTTIHFDPPHAETEMRTWLEPLTTLPLDFHPQCVGDLGARLAEAFAHAFSRPGTRKVLALGGDCPAVDAALLRTAVEALGRTDAVIGPAADGGYYLLGLRTPQPVLFEHVAWSTSVVLQQTRDRLRALGLRVTELPVAADVDTVTDWQRAVAKGLLPGSGPG